MKDEHGNITTEKYKFILIEVMRCAFDIAFTKVHVRNDILDRFKNNDTWEVGFPIIRSLMSLMAKGIVATFRDVFKLQPGEDIPVSKPERHHFCAAIELGFVSFANRVDYYKRLHAVDDQFRQETGKSTFDAPTLAVRIFFFRCI